MLKRQENDVPRTKINSGYRSSPRTSTGSESDVDVSPAKNVESVVPEDTDLEEMDVDVAKTSTQPTTSPRKTPTKQTPKKTPAKSPKQSKTVTPKSAKTTPSVPVKRKSSISPPKSEGKRQKLSTPAKTETPKRKSIAKTPMVKTPPKGQTPNIKTPKDAILKSPKSASKTKTPMVKTPPKGQTPKITTPKDAILDSPAKTPATVSKLKTPKASKTPKVGKTPKSVVKKLGKTPKQSSLYSEIVKKNLGLSSRKVKASRVAGGKVTKLKAQTKPKVVVKTPKKVEKKNEASTGHAESPENIIIGRKKGQTPKVTKKTPKSVAKTKTPRSVVKKLGVRTPALNKSVKKTLWSEIVKKNIGKTPNKGKAVKVLAVNKNIKSKPAKTVSKTPKKVAQLSVAGSTGHVNSPAPVIIAKKIKKVEPVVTKKGRKSDIKKTGKIVEDKTNYDGVADMLQSPAVKTPASKTPKIVVDSPQTGKKSSEKRYPKNLSVLQTHKRLGTPTSESKKRQSMGVVCRKSLGTPVTAKGRKSLGASPNKTPQNKLLNR